MGSKAVAQGMSCDALVDIDGFGGFLDGLLQRARRGVPSPVFAAGSILPDTGRREQILPLKAGRGVFILSGNGKRQLDVAPASMKVIDMQLFALE